ncbi:MAG: transcriptional regulator NrdR [Planctomycetota bacterium]
MICPFCASNDDKVIDSRSTEGGRVIRRRRQCLRCEKRFTTYERIEQANRLVVIKRDGTRVPFDRDKVLAGIVAACGKRPVSEQIKERIVDEIDDELHAEYEREVPSHVIGERVMGRLRHTDPVAYIRFATELMGLDTIEEIRKELDDLMDRPLELREQQPLFDGPAPANAPAKAGAKPGSKTGSKPGSKPERFTARR